MRLTYLRSYDQAPTRPPDFETSGSRADVRNECLAWTNEKGWHEFTVLPDWERGRFEVWAERISS